MIISEYLCVTSDLRTTNYKNEKWECLNCGLIQTNTSKEWKKNVLEIYSKYSVFEISGHVEQKFFSGDTQIARSKYVVDSVLQMIGGGREWLDFGCGDGSTICQVSEADKTAQLFVYDLDKRKEEFIRNKCNLKYFYDQSEFENLKKVDAIIMSHVLEHIENPLEILSKLRDKIKDGGILAVQVPNIDRNYIDLGVYDHVSHFSKETLKFISIESGWQVIKIDEESIPKDIIILLAKNKEYKKNPQKVAKKILNLKLELMNDNLNTKRNKIITFARENMIFSIFGSSIAAIWLSNNCEMKNEMWVDEDISRIGKLWLGKPIVSPMSLKEVSKVVVPYSNNISGSKINELLENKNMMITLL